MTVNRGTLGVVVLSLVASVLFVPTAASARVAPLKVTKLSTQAGPVAGGTTVTVSGSGFSKVTKVLFGRTAGSGVKVASSGRLTVRAPKAAAGTVDVRVVVRKGKSLRTSPVTRADRYTYYAAPAVTSVSPASGSTAGGSRLTISGRNFVRVTKVVFGSTKATKVTVTNTGKLVATSPAHAKGTVDVRVVGAFGTSAVVKGDRFRYDAPAPVAPVSARGYTATPSAITLYFAPTSDTYNDVVIRRATGTVPPDGATKGTAVADLDTDYSEWEDPDLEPGTRYAYSIFVRDSSGRYSTGATLLARTLGAGTNQTWGTAQSVFERQHGGVSALSCTSTTFCAALDQYGSTFFYDGTTWQTGGALGSQAGYNFYPAIACGSPSLCVATNGSTKVYRFDGTSWTGSDVLEGQTPTALSCVSPTFCMAATEEGGAARFDGQHWSEVTTASPVLDGTYSRIESLSCASATFCAAIDVFGRAVRYNGSKWSTPTVVGDNGSHASVSCATPTSCLAALSVSGTSLTSWNGTKWTPVTNVPDGFSPEIVACSSASSCIVRSSFQTRNYDGHDWSDAESIPTNSSGSDGLTCTRDAFCVATTTNGASVRPNGETWSEASDFDPAGGGVQSVSCAAGPFCLAVDTTGNVKTYQGGEWSAAASLDSAPSGLSCVSATFCLAVSYESAMVFDGTSWSPVAAISEGQVQRVSCASATLCVADDGNGTSWIYDGSTWRKKAIPIDFVYAVSCVPGGTRCVAVGGGIGDEEGPGQSSTFDGTQWSKAVTVAAGSVSDLTCVTATFCLANTYDEVVRFDGTTWSTLTRLGASIYDVACASTTSCVAVTAAGGSTYDGETWSTPNQITDDTQGTPGRVVCADAGHCFGLSEGGLFYRAP